MCAKRDIASLSKLTTSPTTLGIILGVSPQRADQLLHPEKHRARRQAQKLTSKPDHCQLCPEAGELQKHHYDYRRPDAVLWLCVKCHNLLDSKLCE